jgi:hypothetical protein
MRCAALAAFFVFEGGEIKFMKSSKIEKEKTESNQTDKFANTKNNRPTKSNPERQSHKKDRKSIPDRKSTN